uniref:Uncharacterized protein n=1 Tax=Ralstonia solanacearum TaxID=305 RepID=A0A0S4WPZ6_RALSL|nr:protein of unknown function [Ralstonia solanacearum]
MPIPEATLFRSADSRSRSCARRPDTTPYSGVRRETSRIADELATLPALSLPDPGAGCGRPPRR